MKTLGIDQNIIDEIDFDLGSQFYIPLLEKSETDKGYFFVIKKTIHEQKEFDQFLIVSEEIAKDINKKYGEQYVEYFYEILNRYLEVANVYRISTKNNIKKVFDSVFQIADVDAISIEKIEFSLILMINATYGRKRFNFDFSKINFELKQDDIDKEKVAAFPNVSNIGVVASFANHILDVEFIFVPLKVFDELKAQIEAASFKEYAFKAQLLGQLERLKKDSKQLVEMMTYHSENTRETLNRLSYDYSNYLGVDISNIFKEKNKD